jgi:hypothetical protein
MHLGVEKSSQILTTKESVVVRARAAQTDIWALLNSDKSSLLR